MNPGGGEISGTFFKPAVLYPVTRDMRLFKEEQFGPLVPVMTYEKPKEIVQYLNSLGFTQQASLFGGDTKLRQKWIDKLSTLECRVNIEQQCMRGPDSIPFVGRGTAAKKILSIKDALYAFTLPVILSGKSEADIAALSVSGGG
jgi:glyceraldehyde-3-phosphate dehydrogenase (NADP+)